MSQQFPNDFLFGVATAAYQVEGAAHEAGRGPSIWDTFARTPGKTHNGDTGDVACDQFHRYAEDVALMKQLGVGAYRFSIAWPRIFPEGAGKLNRQGFDYYHRLVDALLAAGIRPAATLYHWDLPQALEDKGGWPHRDTAYHFADYAQACFDALGDKIDFWITLNEPTCVAMIGYERGHHAPGRTDGPASFRAAHHLNLGHGLAVRAFRASGKRGVIGASLNPPCPYPASNSEADVRAAERWKDKLGRIFSGPMFGKGYPESLARYYPDRPIPVVDGDMEIIAAPTDFLGLNIYFDEVVAHDPTQPDGIRKIPRDLPKTGMDWDVCPDSITNTISWMSAECGHPPIYVTENGTTFKDVIGPDGECHDPDRIAFLHAYLDNALHCIKQGYDLRGYFLWSFIDNYEWAFGYSMRFGLVHCDFQTLKRTPKGSYYFYQNLIASRSPDAALASARSNA